MKRYILLIILFIFIVTVAWILRQNKKILKSEELLSEATTEVIPVSVETISPKSLQERFTFTGVLKPENELMIISQTQGQVEGVFYELGDFVEMGKVVVQVEKDLLAAQLQLTEAGLGKARKDIERFEKMAEIDGVTQDQLEKMRLNLENAEAQYITTKKRYEDTSIKAPFSGYINQVFTKKGSMLGPGAPVFELVDISGFKMTIKCSEDEIMHITRGMEVKVRPKFIEDVVLDGKVSKVAVSADMAQQFTVEVSIKQSNEDRLKGGMVAIVEIRGREWADVLAVNKNSIDDIDGTQYVYLFVDEAAVLTEVITGITINEMVEIKQGIAPGDLIITSALTLLSDGQKVKIAD